jgi:hypothetical protein
MLFNHYLEEPTQGEDIEDTEFRVGDQTVESEDQCKSKIIIEKAK